MSIFLAYVIVVVGWSAPVARLLGDAELHWILQGYLGWHTFAMPHKGLGRCLQDGTVTSPSDPIRCIPTFCIQFWSYVSARLYQSWDHVFTDMISRLSKGQESVWLGTSGVNSSNNAHSQANDFSLKSASTSVIFLLVKLLVHGSSPKEQLVTTGNRQGCLWLEESVWLSQSLS